LFAFVHVRSLSRTGWHVAAQLLVKLPKQERAQTFAPIRLNSGLAVFCHFLGLARPLQSVWHARRMVRRAVQGRKEMTASFTQLATSLLAALVTSTIFISAAVGPVGQFI
jgi:hypothetical protein